MLLVLASLALILADQRWQWFGQLESRVAGAATPVYWLAALPGRVWDWGDDLFTNHAALREDNARLAARNLVLAGKVQKLAFLEAEIQRLRQLLNSSTLVGESVLIAELVAVSSDPQRQWVAVDKDASQGVYVGQPVIDAHGLVGQVVQVTPGYSRILLITDATHALPVQINRNGVRTIAEGTGRIDQLALRHVAATTDIVVGDLLVSSGLGGVFPAGYPVAVVTEITEDPGQPFLIVKARPSAQLDRSRHLLLVFRASEKPDA